MRSEKIVEEAKMDADSPLPHIMETTEDLVGGEPKDHLVGVLDRMERFVEQLRKDALRLEEEKDTILTTLDTLKSNEMIISLQDCKYR